MMMNRIRPVVTAVLVAAILTGCATLPAGGGNNPEREIFIQAMMAGAAVGAGVGAGAGYAIAGRGHRATGALVGGLAGAIAGAIIGRMTAEAQVRTLHDYQMDNRRLAALLQTAEQRNQAVAQYNQQLEREIAGLKSKDKAMRGQIASAKLKEARQNRQAVQRAMADRRELAGKLAAPQRAQYEQTLNALQQEDQRLEHSITRLTEMEQPVVGGAGSDRRRS